MENYTTNNGAYFGADGQPADITHYEKAGRVDPYWHREQGGIYVQEGTAKRDKQDVYLFHSQELGSFTHRMDRMDELSRADTLGTYPLYGYYFHEGNQQINIPEGKIVLSLQDRMENDKLKSYLDMLRTEIMRQRRNGIAVRDIQINIFTWNRIRDMLRRITQRADLEDFTVSFEGNIPVRMEMLNIMDENDGFYIL